MSATQKGINRSSIAYIAAALGQSQPPSNLENASSRFARKLDAFEGVVKQYSNMVTLIDQVQSGQKPGDIHEVTRTVSGVRDNTLLAFAHLDVNLDEADFDQFDRFNQLKAQCGQIDQRFSALVGNTDQHVDEQQCGGDDMAPHKPMNP